MHNNCGEPFCWRNNVQLISKVYLKKHTSQMVTYIHKPKISYYLKHTFLCSHRLSRTHPSSLPSSHNYSNILNRIEYDRNILNRIES